METIILTRLQSGDHGTFGVIRHKNQIFYTGELPWRENKSNISCVPAGTYICRWTHSPRFGRFMYLIDGVSDRTGIRAHSANFMGDSFKKYRCQLNGCIAMGERVGVMDGQQSLLISSPAVKKFESLMERQTFRLEIIDAIN